MPTARLTGTVEVLLATFNGERFLAAQLDSLLKQSWAEFSVLVSDDCSTDATPDILHRYAAAYPTRFRILPHPSARLGASGNFARLVDAASADFVFFCDQDDVWLPDKMAVTIARMEQLAASHPAGTPLLVHTDLAVVDADLNLLGQSFFRFAGIDPARNSLGGLLMANIATGCTTLANRALYEVARPIPRDALMYDHWLAQVAAALGAISYIDRSTVLYRQHSMNAIGADRASANSVATRAYNILFSDKTLRVLTAFTRHAALLLERYGPRMREADRTKAMVMANLWLVPAWRRYALLRRTGLRKATFIANVGLALLVLRSGGTGYAEPIERGVAV